MKLALNISVVLLMFLGAISCKEDSTKKPQKDFLNNPKVPLPSQIKRLLTEGHQSLPLGQSDRKKLYVFYQQIGFQPVYADRAIGQTIKKNWISTLSRHAHFGLPETRIAALQNKPELIQELLLNHQIGTIVHDLDSGFIDFKRRVFKEKTWKKYPIDWLTKPKNTDSLLLSCGPADTNYRYFAQHLYHFCDTAVLDTLHYEVVSEKEHKTLTWQQVQKALLGLGYIQLNSDSLAIRLALKKYQRNQGLNPDGRIGESTSIAFKRSKQIQLYQAQISLDRLRQKEPTPSKLIQINLPSFELVFIADDTLRAKHRVIIGKMDHPTPELQSKITQIVSLPYWNVPYSIAKNEILPALKRNSAYLEKEHMRIYRKKDQEIDPKTVNWKKIKNKTFPYQIIQDPGPWNSLGLIKFEFSNSFSVYVHDTPNRYLFEQKFRSFSHGCMRADAPIELGKLLLHFDKKEDKFNEVTPDSLQTLIDQRIHQKISLQKAIPIQVLYQTVTADKDGLYFYIDLYRREQDLINLFQSRNNG